MRTHPAMLAGVSAPLIYAAAVVLGGWLTPGYSHLASPISELIMPGAPATFALDPLFTVYNALIIVFAFDLRRAFRRKGVAISPVAPLLLALVGLMGILMRLYPMDPIGALISFRGRMHIWLAGIAALSTVLAMLFVALPLRRSPAWWRFAGYTLISLIVTLFSGALAALAAARTSPVMGLWERVTIGAFLQWVFVLALALAFDSRPARAG